MRSSAAEAPAPDPGAWRPLPWIEPGAALAAFAGEKLAFLDSRGPIGPASRYALLALHPFRELTWSASSSTTADPLDALTQQIAACALPPAASPVPFAAGAAIGFIGYEFPSPFHPAPTHPRPADQPDLAFLFSRTLIAFDRARRQAWLACDDAPEAAAIAARLRATPRLFPRPHLVWREETPRAVHEARIRRVLAYIEAGDIYQANLTARFLAARPKLDAVSLHLALRRASPAPYAAYLDLGPSLAIASASPECFVTLTPDGALETRPIKGTRPRGTTAKADADLAQALCDSSKDRAENLMIADLLRHDVGRVAAIGSVQVPALHTLETFPAVHHLVSTIRARLRPRLGPVDVLRALHPGGSITGAPKRRAMEIIAELEPAPRGPYCGSLVHIGFDGALASSILIRTLTIGPDTVTAQAGGGIVAESDPAEEYAEMRLKLRPLLEAFGDAA